MGIDADEDVGGLVKFLNFCQHVRHDDRSLESRRVTHEQVVEITQLNAEIRDLIPPAIHPYSNRCCFCVFSRAHRMEKNNSKRMTWLGKGIAAVVDFFAAFGSTVQAVVSVMMVNLCVAGSCVVDWTQWAMCMVETFVGTVFPSLWGGFEEVVNEAGKVLKSVSTFLQFLPPLVTILIVLVLAMIAKVVFNFATLKVDSPYFAFANSSR